MLNLSLVSVLLVACAAAIATGAPVSVRAGDDSATQVRLAYAGPGGMAVSWYTDNQPSATPAVTYGLSASLLTLSATGYFNTYGTGFFSNVILTSLAPKTTYYYRINSEPTIRSFTTAPTPGDATPFSVGIVGDLGLVNSKNTISGLAGHANYTDFYWLIGDLSYADDWFLRPGDTYEGSWNRWQVEMQAMTAVRPTMVLSGNHDVTCSEATPFICEERTRNFTAYLHRFRMPFAESGGVNNLWYSYDYGMVHFVSITTETDFPGSPEGPGTFLGGGGFGDQLAWLEKDLARAAANRGAVPWIVVGGHRPFYSVDGGCDACKKAFEPLFLKYKVDVFFAGHVHLYEREYAIANGTVVDTSYVNPAAPVHVIVGCGGNVEGHQAAGSKKDFDAFINDQDFGYGRLEVLNRNTLKWHFYRAADGQELDSFVLSKN